MTFILKMDMINNLHPVKSCFYCKTYQSILSAYPVNPGTEDNGDLTPRCKLHYQYTCHHCEQDKHFNGIAWCSDCKSFTCVQCAQEKIVRERFFYYDFYYSIPCLSCDGSSPALDYAEHNLTHPYQTGDLRPDFPINLWVPIETTIPHEKHIGKGWGSNRIKALSRGVTFKKLNDPQKDLSQDVWNANADKWGPLFVKDEDGDFHHKNIILPSVLRLIDFGNHKTGTKLLDVGCGVGNLSRKFSRAGYKVIGVDFSEKMLAYALREEENEDLGITYHHRDARELDQIVEEESFDLVLSNMAIMDMDNFKQVFKGIHSALKLGGIFVFSISHPVFAWPGTQTIKLPRDSQRNEDKIWVVDNYFDTRATTVEFRSFELLFYRRTVSEYINTLISTGFEILEMEEPFASEELIEREPRKAFRDEERVPQFMMFKVKKR